MPTINVSLPSDGDTIDAADYNTPITTIVNAINGNLDGDNLDSTASFVMDSLTANSVTIAGTAATQGWTSLPDPPNTVTANGNRSYDLVFNSNDLTDTLSPGMRLKATRTVTAPTQCADLEASSSHYFNKTSPAGMTFTDDFVVSAWVKLESIGSAMTIASRYNGTSGYDFQINSSGQVALYGFNAGATNSRGVTSYQSLPLNKWVHVSAQLDMSTYTATTTTCYVMIDGVDVPASLSTNGTNPTALIQAGNLEIGGRNGGLQPFDGKIAQVAIYSAKVTQATVLASMHQTLTGSETSLISAYSLNNSLTDLNTGNANNLSAQNSAVATATDTPFAGGATGTTEYGIVTAATFSTNTTLTVQVPEGYALPTTGGISAVSYSISKIPYGFPVDSSKWELLSLGTTSAGIASTTYGLTSHTLGVPIGAWEIGYNCVVATTRGSTSFAEGTVTLTATSTTEDDSTMTSKGTVLYGGTANTHTLYFPASRDKLVSQSSATTYYLQVASQAASITTNLQDRNKIYARCCYL